MIFLCSPLLVLSLQLHTVSGLFITYNLLASKQIIKLPKQQEKPITSENITIVIKKNNYSLDEKSNTDLILLIANSNKTSKLKSDQKIVLRAEASVKYQRIINTMLKLQKNGYENLRLETDK